MISFPTTALLDDFTRANGTLAAGNWTQLATAGEQALNISSNKVTGSTGSGSTNGAFWNVGQFQNCEVLADVVTLPTAGDWVSLWLRLSSAAGTNSYILRVTPSTSTWDFRKRVGGPSASIGTNTSTPLLAGDSFGASVIGSTLTAYRKTGGVWSRVFSVTDTSVTAAGYVGIELLNNVSFVDNFYGGTIVPSFAALSPGSSTFTAAAPNASGTSRYGSAVYGVSMYGASGIGMAAKTPGTLTLTAA